MTKSDMRSVMAEDFVIIKDLRLQLAEKDKENKLLRDVLNNLKGEKASDTLVNAVNAVYEPLIEERMRQIRHQVCQEIKERALDLYYFTPSEVLEHFGGNYYLLAKYDLEEILDQIEKGETK